MGTDSKPLFIKKALMTFLKSLELKSTGGVPIAIGTNSTPLLNFKHKKSSSIKRSFFLSTGGVPIAIGTNSTPPLNFKHKKSSSIKRSFFLSADRVPIAIGTNSTPLFIKKALMTLKKSLELKSTGGVPIDSVLIIKRYFSLSDYY